MDFFSAMRIASTGLSVQRTRMNVTSSNLANIETTRTEEGGAYQRRTPIVAAVPLSASFEEIFGDIALLSDTINYLYVLSTTKNLPQMVTIPMNLFLVLRPCVLSRYL